MALKDMGSLGSQMSHLHRRVWSNSIVQDPEVLGGIPAMMSFHVYQLGKEISILQRMWSSIAGSFGLGLSVDVIERMYV